MRRTIRNAARAVFGALVLGALGFGSAQLAASPAPRTNPYENTCNGIECLELCGPEWICYYGRCHCGG